MPLNQEEFLLSSSGATGEGEVAGHEETTSLQDLLSWAGDLLVRRRWWLLITVAVVSLSANFAIFRIPDQYKSEAVLVLVQPKISERYVSALHLTTASAVVDDLKREVLSQKSLISIINAFGLYPKQRRSHTPEALAERMRKDVEIELIGAMGSDEHSGFRVSFTADTPATAHAITSRLASVFIEENRKDKGAQAVSTRRFLAAEVLAAGQKLQRQEERLRDFKLTNLVELPEQQQANLAAITDLRIELQNATAAIRRARQQLTDLELSLNAGLARLQQEREGLLSRLTTRHPLVAAKAREMAALDALLVQLKAGRIDGPLPGTGFTEDHTMIRMRGQLAATLEELQSGVTEEQRIRARLSQYESRMKLTPVREQQLAVLLRDYDLLKQNYLDLQAKQMQAQLTITLEEQQEGQHFRLIDPPTLPQAPFSPKRLTLSLRALAAAIGLGIALALAVDLLDPSFHNEREVRKILRMPVVGVPLILTPAEEQGRKLTRAFEWVGAITILCCVLAAEYHVYRNG